ncbi:diguanylate cyclase, partial [Escherichia coli]
MRCGHGGSLHRVATGGTPRLVGTTVELPAQHKDGTEFLIELSLSMWSENGRSAFGSIVRDIRDRRANEERLFRLAHLDPLTELPNRTVLRNRIKEVLAQSQPMTLLMLDLDGFKGVNDALGHAAGDAVLKRTAERLLSCVRAVDTVSRLGGDEFA